MPGRKIIRFMAGLTLGFAGLTVVGWLAMTQSIASQFSAGAQGAEWRVSSKARGGDQTVIAAARPGVSVRIRCRGDCDDVRIQRGPGGAEPARLANPGALDNGNRQ